MQTAENLLHQERRLGVRVAAVLAHQTPSLVSEPPFDIGRIIDQILPRLPKEFRVSVRRPDDLLVFDLIFMNLALAAEQPPRLKKQDANTAAFFIIEFPPQSFGEETFLEKSDADLPPVDPDFVAMDTDSVPPLPSSRVRMAGRSRIAFAMPEGESSLPYTLDAVLAAFRTWPMRLDVNATPDSEFSIFGRDWLSALTASAGWASVRSTVGSALSAIGGAGSEPAIARAAGRLADRAAAGIAAGLDEDLRTVLQELMRSEADRIGERFPQLRAGLSRDATVAALSLAATEAFASMVATRLDANAIAHVPFLPIVFAPHQPSRSVTALELPYRLVLSPLAPARWLHRDHPVEQCGRTELWHTRLTTAEEDFGPDAPSKVRAIWSPDYPIEQFDTLLGPPPLPFRMSLDPLDRKMLVQLMAGFNESGPGRRRYTPRASEAKRLHLTSLGALLDAEGNWNPRPQSVDLEQWRHLATLGRDHYVRVMYAGTLGDFGHAASLVKVTERKFESLGGDSRKRIAVLRQRFFIVVRERVKNYTGANHQFGGRNFPFRRVEILTRVTPDLVEPGAAPTQLDPGPSGLPIYVGAVQRRMVFWPMVPAGSATPVDFRFDVAATDLDGNRVTFSLPLLFIGETANRDNIDAIRDGYNASHVQRRRAELGGATVAFAPFDLGDKGDPRLPTARMTFAMGALTTKFELAPNYYPEIEQADVGVRAIQKMLGLSNFVVPVAYPQVYKEHGFGAADPSKNPGKLFLQLTTATPLSFGGGAEQAKSDALGALASPQMVVQGLSKIMGPVAAKLPANPSDPKQIESALGHIINNRFDPTEFFKDAKILGGINLSDLLSVATSLAGSDVPKLLSREFPDRVEASFAWTTEVTQSDPLKLIVPRADPAKAQTTLAMNGLVTTPIKNPGDASFEATASIDNFKVNLFGFIIIWFELLKFVAKKGQKPDVQVSLRKGDDAVQFGGPLEFVNELRKFIPSNGFSDPPSLSVTPSGISAAYSLTLPTIGVSIFSLSNASLGAGFNLPFDSQPCSVNFRFSERQHPFSLTVSLLGGGGFFAIGVSARGVTEIEAALEFGAAVAIDLGVASGAVEVKAGVYFHWLEPIPDKGSIDLAGYVRIHGELCVLAIISVSLTFNLQLGYHKEGGNALMYGEATLVVEIEVLFFSAEVSVRCRREFGGSAADPKFIDLMPNQGLWSEYCDAFVAEAA